MPTTTVAPPPAGEVASIMPKKGSRSRPLFDLPIVRRAIVDSLVKLHPRTMMKNPVMFVVEVGAAMTTLLAARDLAAGAGTAWFTLQITVWLWFTVLFANFAEAMAEGRGKAQADTLRKTKTETHARRMLNGARTEMVPATVLRSGDTVLVEAGETIPGDGDVIEGIASVDESAITGESAPVIRESGGDRSAVTGGTKVLSDWIKVRITSNPGETFLDRMIALVEGAQRQKTPNEIALNIVIVRNPLIVRLDPLYNFRCDVPGALRVGNDRVVTNLMMPPREIGVIHLANWATMRQTYLEQNLLYRSGHYLSPAERARIAS